MTSPRLVYSPLAPPDLDDFHRLVVDEHTEMGRAAIAAARARPGFAEIVTSVDAPNAASLRVLEKLGFEVFGALPGAFGDILMLRLPGP